MRATFDLVHHLPSKRSFLIQWPGSHRFFGKTKEPTVLASTPRDGTRDLMRALGPGVPISRVDDTREASALNETQALTTFLIIEMLNARRSGGAEGVFDHIRRMSTDAAGYWVSEMMAEDPKTRSAARRALALMAE